MLNGSSFNFCEQQCQWINIVSRNSFYTTAANRMSRHLFANAVTNEDVVALCRENRKGA